MHSLSNFDSCSVSAIDGGGGGAGQQAFGRLAASRPLKWSAGEQDLADKVADWLLNSGLVAETDQDIIDNPGNAQAGSTFFGQFIDHDITLDVSSAVSGRACPDHIRNVRTPTLDLDCVYGDGEEGSPLLYANPGKKGNGGHRGFLTLGTSKNRNDLARDFKGTAIIGDFRNDENSVLAAIQALFIRAHNALYQKAFEGRPKAVIQGWANYLHSLDPTMSDGLFKEISQNEFKAARFMLKTYYHQLVTDEFLGEFVNPSVLADIESQVARDRFLGANPFLAEGLIPVEFSVAGFRFGHATVRNEYTLEPNGSPEPIFNPAGGSAFGKPFEARDTSINLTQFFGVSAQRARPIGLRFAQQIMELPKRIVGGPLEFFNATLGRDQAAILPLRNILRDRLRFDLASFEDLAHLVKEHEVAKDILPIGLREIGFQTTPLFVGILAEAGRQENEGRLGAVGGGLVASTLYGLICRDPEALDPIAVRRGNNGKGLNDPAMPLHRRHYRRFTMSDLIANVETLEQEVGIAGNQSRFFAE